jgi:hypothetical protein
MKHRISKFILSICLLVFSSPTASAQDQTEQAGSSRSPQSSDGPQTKPAMSFGLEDGTVVKLRLVRDLFSAKVEDEEMRDFEVMAFFFPAAPFFLLKKGKEMTIPKGTLMTSFIDGDVPLDRKRFE